MISEHIIKNRLFRFFVIVGVFLGIFGLVGIVETSKQRPLEKAEKLHIQSKHVLPLREISGLYRNHSSGEIYAVGDSQAIIAQISSSSQSRILPFQSIDLTQALLDEYAMCASDKIPTCVKMKKLVTTQWEGLFLEKGNIAYLLNEQLATIVTVDLEKHKILGHMNLSYFREPKRDLKREKTDLDPANGLAEGVTLLQGGRVLIAKERKKPMLVEFGLEGTEAKGYITASGHQVSTDFSLKEGRWNLVPLKRWKLPKGYKDCDLSELNHDQDGNLYLLSQRCGWIAQLDDLQIGDHRMSFKNIWLLPSTIKHAEAFVVLNPEQDFIVAEDKKSTKKPNLFYLSVEQKLAVR